MWVFVLGDLAMFTMYFTVFTVFTVFAVYRGWETAAFAASARHLDLVSGAVNTVILATSSRLVALAVRAARPGDRGRALRRLYCAGACGVVFAAVKAGEWAALISGGYTVTRGDFFMFYFALTGVHLFHVLVGLVILAVVARFLRAGRPGRVTLIESGALYWHLVDLVWLVIFTLLYLIR
jgi:nitric oxide reductase NorE protein